MLYYEASTNLKAPVSTSASTVPSTGGDVISKQGPNPLPFPATPQDPSSYRPDNLRWHRSQLSTVLMIFKVLTLSITIFLQGRSHNNRHTLHTTVTSPSPLSWVDWKKNSPTMRQHSSKQIDVQPAYCYILHNKSNTPTVTSLSPSHHQWKAVRSGQPARRGPRTSSIFSRIQPLSRRRATSSPRADSTSGQHSEHPHASQAAVSPTYLSRHLSAFASRMQVLDQQIELIVTASVGLVWSGQRQTRRDRKPLRAPLLTLPSPSKEEIS